MNGLYFQPEKLRHNDDALPTAPSQGQDVYALINELTNRINQATRKIEHKVDSNALAKILLTDRDLVLMGDQVNIVGQLNIVDWVRNVSGNISGGIDAASMTRITGGKVQTGVIESFNWSVMAGSQIDLDNGTIVTGGSVSPKFSVNSAGQLTCVDAVVTGTLQAGSIISGSVTLNDAFGPSLDDIASGSDVQSALTAGVTNILAGIGSDFRLEVDASNGFVALKHKDAVFLGTAASGSVKPALGISASGIGMGYNRSSDGLWVTSMTLDAAGNIAMLGTLTAGSVIVNSVTIDGTAIGTISAMAQEGYNISETLLNSGTAVLKGVIVPTNSGAIKTGTITWNAVTGALSGGTGVAQTEWGIIGAASGEVTFTLDASTGAATFAGNITGGANINITGQGVFNGTYSTGGLSAAIHANTSLNASQAIVAWCGGDSTDIGLYAFDAGTGTGVYAYNSSAGTGGVAISAVRNNSAGVALRVIGRMTISRTDLVSNLNAERWNGFTTGSLTTGGSTANFVANNKPGSNSSNVWWVFTNGSTTLRIPAWLT